MERIKKALQLASEERASSEVGGQIALGQQPAVAPSEGGLEFEYVQTRVIEVPPSVLEHHRVVTGRAQDPVTVAYKRLRTHVLQRLAREDWQTVAVVSPAAGDGKTLTAINLSVNIGTSRSHTALLADLDWRKPSVHRYFDYDPEYDIGDYLSGGRGLESVLVNPDLPRFCFLPRRAPVPDSSEQLASLGAFVRALKARYRNRVVLFDLPPLLGTDDALSFIPHVDCVLLVIQEGKTTREDLTRCLELLDPNRLLGTVVNRSRQPMRSY